MRLDNCSTVLNFHYFQIHKWPVQLIYTLHRCNCHPQCINIGAAPLILSLRFQTIQDNADHANDQAYPPSIGPVMNCFVFEMWILMMWTRLLHMYYTNNYAWHRVQVPDFLPLFRILPEKRNATLVRAHPCTVGWFMEFSILETGNLREKGLMIRV